MEEKLVALPREVSRTCGCFFFGNTANNCCEKSAEAIVDAATSHGKIHGGLTKHRRAKP